MPLLIFERLLNVPRNGQIANQLLKDLIAFGFCLPSPVLTCLSSLEHLQQLSYWRVVLSASISAFN
jgi:hypothetical protein